MNKVQDKSLQNKEDNNFLGAILLLATATVGLVFLGLRELFGKPGPVLGLLGWGYAPALIAMLLLTLSALVPKNSRNLLIFALGMSVLAAAGVLATHITGLDWLVRGFVVLGSLLAWRAATAPMKALAGIPNDRYDGIRFWLVTIWLIYAVVTLSPLGTLHLGVIGWLVWQMMPATIEAVTRLFAPSPASFDHQEEKKEKKSIEFEPATPTPSFTPEQQAVVNRLVDFINQNYNRGFPEKWPDPRVIPPAFDAPGYTTYVLELPMIFSGKTLIQRTSDLAAALRIDEERLNIMTGGKHGGLLIQISKTDEQKRASVAWYDDVLTRFGHLVADKNYEVILGLNEFGEPITADLSDLNNPHLLVAGRAGSGKSQMIHAILAQLITKNGPDKVEFIFIDPKGVTGNFYLRANLPHLVDALINEDDIASEGPELLKMVAAELERRQQILINAGVSNAQEYNRRHPDTPLSLYLLVIDEAQDLADSPNEALKGAYANYVGAIARKGRSNLVCLIIGVQKPTQKAVGDFRLNLTRRIVLRLDKNSSPLALDDNNDMSATKLSGKGDAFYVNENIKTRFNSIYLPENGDPRRPNLSLTNELHKVVERYGAKPFESRNKRL